MKKLSIKKPEEVKERILQYLNSSEELKFSHKLHAILLLLENEHTNCSEVSRIYGSTPQSLAMWVHRLNEGEGGNIEGLRDKAKSGRNTRVTNKQLQEIKYAIRWPPKQYGMESVKWDGKTLSAFLHKKYGVNLKIRMCQRWLQKLKQEHKDELPPAE